MSDLSQPVEPDIARLERAFYRWQEMAHACLYCGKPQGRPWSLQLSGTCPITGISMQFILREETLFDLERALLGHPLIKQIFSDPRVRAAIGLDTSEARR